MGSSAALHHPLAFLKRFISYSFFFLPLLYGFRPHAFQTRLSCWLVTGQTMEARSGRDQDPATLLPPLCFFLFVVRVYVYDGITTPGMQDEAAAAAAQTTAVAWSRAVAC